MEILFGDLLVGLFNFAKMLKLTPKIGSDSTLIFTKGKIILLFDWDQEIKAKICIKN